MKRISAFVTALPTMKPVYDLKLRSEIRASVPVVTLKINLVRFFAHCSALTLYNLQPAICRLLQTCKIDGSFMHHFLYHPYKILYIRLAEIITISAICRPMCLCRKGPWSNIQPTVSALFFHNNIEHISSSSTG